MKSLVHSHAQALSVYLCSQCGFKARQFYWRCPACGGWGGRYALYQAHGETRPIWTNNQESRDTLRADNGQTECTDMATIWRWREAYQNDFAARMDWCATGERKKANHAPEAIVKRRAVAVKGGR